MLSEYYKRVTSAVRDIDLQRLWSITVQLDGLAKTRKEASDLRAEIKRLLMDDVKLGPLSRNIIKLWYRGDWPDGAARFGTAFTSAQAYREGLLWKAMRTHPSGAKQSGFGSWSRPPATRHSKQVNSTEKKHG